MIDPVTATAVVSGLVNTLTAYMTYKVGMSKGGQEHISHPAQNPALVQKQGEAALAVAEGAVSVHGNVDEQTALTGFLQNPKLFRTVLEEALTTLALREPDVLRQFQSIAGQATSGGASVTASGERSVAGLNWSGSTIVTGDNNQPN